MALLIFRTTKLKKKWGGNVHDSYSVTDINSKSVKTTTFLRNISQRVVTKMYLLTVMSQMAGWKSTRHHTVSVTGPWLSVGGRHLPDPWPTVQAHRLHRLFLHPARSDATYLRSDGQTTGCAAAKFRRRRRRMVKWLAGSRYTLSR